MRHRAPTHIARPAKPRRIGLAKLAGGAAAALALAVAIPAGLAAAGDGPAGPKTVIATDSFNRSVSDGLGKATVGGSYSIYPTENSPFSVANGHADVNALAPGGSTTAYLPKVSSRDTEISAQVGARDRSPVGLYAGVDLRRQQSGDRYRAKAGISAGGRVTLSIARVGPGGLDKTLALRLLPIALEPDHSITLDAQISGTGSVVVAARAWVTGTAQPGWQLTAKDESATAINNKGSVGLWGYESRAASAASFTFAALTATSFDSTTPLSPASGSGSATPSAPATSGAAAPTTVTPSMAAPTTTAAAPSTSASGGTSNSATTGASTSAPAGTTTSATTPSTATTSATTAAPSAPSVPVSTASAGSAPVGSARYPVPSGAIFVSASSGSDSSSGSSGSPLRTVSAAVSRASSGATIVLRAGTYHETVNIPASKSGLTIQAYPGEAVWFDGSSAVTDWSQSGSNWVHYGWTAQFDHSASFTTGVNQSAFINPSYPLAAWPDQALVDGSKLAQVWPGSVGPGKFAVDYGAHTLTIGTNPNGQSVRASDLERAFVIQASGVTLQGFGVHNYATPLPRMGAIELQGKNDTVRDLVISDNATQGISFGAPEEVGQYLTVSGNGMVGIHGVYADGLTIANSEVTGNNSENFNPSPSSGGMKIGRTRGVTITSNVVENNVNTKQIWLDESVVGFTIANNTVSGSLIGIDTEISDTGIIANNRVSGGTRGVFIYNTGNVKVFNNSFTGQSVGSVFLSQDYRRQASAGDPGHDPRAAVPDPTDSWLLRNITVANNTFGGYANGGMFQFYALDNQTNRSADSMNLVISGNAFVHRDNSSQPTMVGWGGGDNHTITRFETPAQLAAAKNPSWTNLQPSGSASNTLTTGHGATSSAATPLPSDVAQAVGQAVGTKRVGTF